MSQVNDENFPCPTCGNSFPTQKGMKVHHSQNHSRSIDNNCRDIFRLYNNEYDEEEVLITIYDDSTGEVKVIFGRLFKTGFTHFEFNSDTESYHIVWLGGANPPGFYIYKNKRESITEGYETLGRIIEIKIVEGYYLSSGEDKMEVKYSDVTSLTEKI